MPDQVLAASKLWKDICGSKSRTERFLAEIGLLLNLNESHSTIAPPTWALEITTSPPGKGICALYPSFNCPDITHIFPPEEDKGCTQRV